MSIDMRDVEHLDAGWSFDLWGPMYNTSSDTATAYELQGYATEVVTDGVDSAPVLDVSAHNAEDEEADLDNVSLGTDSQLPAFGADDYDLTCPFDGESSCQVSIEDDTWEHYQSPPAHFENELDPLAKDDLEQWLDEDSYKLAFTAIEALGKRRGFPILSVKVKNFLEQTDIASVSQQKQGLARTWLFDDNRVGDLYHNESPLGQFVPGEDHQPSKQVGALFEAGLSWLECWQHTLAGVGTQFTDQHTALQNWASVGTHRTGLTCSSASEGSFSCWEDVSSRNSSGAASVYSIGSKSTPARAYSYSRRISPRTIASSIVGTSREAHLHRAYMPARPRATQKTVWVCRPLTRSSSGQGLCLVCGALSDEQVCSHRMYDCWSRKNPRKPEFYYKHSMKRHLTGYHHVPEADVAQMVNRLEVRKSFRTFR